MDFTYLKKILLNRRKNIYVGGKYSDYKKGWGECPKVERSISVKHIKDGHLPRPSEAAGFNLYNERLSKHLVSLGSVQSG